MVAACAILFGLYVIGTPSNPPGFYVDESALSYNAYLISQTGAGETGEIFPLFFPVYAEPFTQYANPTQIYLLALLFKITGPSIFAARTLAAACVFVACVLLGLLARRMTGRSSVGIAVAGLALTTPWLFEVGRVVLETFFYPLAVVLLLWSVYRASLKERWGWVDCLAIAASLCLLTYSYTIGRLLGPLLAGGLLIFVTDRRRLVSVLSTWLLYAGSLIPFLVYWYRNPELSSRFRTLSYLKPGRSVIDIASQFFIRYFEDLNPLTMLLRGDINPRHHLPGALGSFLIGTFVLSLAGLAMVVLRHRRDRWWLYVVFGLFASVVPGALTVDAFHTLRMVAYPVFLLMLTVPALERLAEIRIVPGAMKPTVRQTLLLAAAFVILGLTAAQAGIFFYKYHTTGADRGEYFDAGYRPLYEIAVEMPDRPIYLKDGYWGPMYVHALWYAAIERRDPGEFVHLPYGKPPPGDSLVLSSEQSCSGCILIKREGDLILYRTLGTIDAADQLGTR